MITEQAIVTGRDGNRVEIELQRVSACGGCELNQGCGTGALGRLLGRRTKPLVIETRQDLKPGDHLELALSEAALVKASLLAYGLPLLCMIAAGLCAAALGAAELWVAILAVAGFYLGFKFAAHCTSVLEQGALIPYIVRIDVNPAQRSGS